jgi:arsenate reductase (thioredoxin)
MNDRPSNDMFLCARDSARSIIAVCIINKLGEFKGYSTRNQPRGKIYPLAWGFALTRC